LITRFVRVGLLSAVIFFSACGGPRTVVAPASGPAAGTAAPAAFDLVITGGRVVDGTGAPWVQADVGLVGDRIAAIGRLTGQPAKATLDASGLVVAPGFIDMLGQSEFNVLVDARAASKITQGITTEITGEGGSIAPLNDRMAAEEQARYDHFKVPLDFRTLGEYFTRLEQRSRPAINIGSFVGAGGLRSHVIGDVQRAATAQELEQMKTLVAQAMDQGALGLSTSLQYVPDRFASTDELVELARVAAARGGIYITHQRSESSQIMSSLDEAFAIAERANIPAEVWHLKTAYRANWGRMPAVLKRFEEARQHVSLRSRVERPRRVPAAVGPRGRARADAGAAEGSGPAREDQARHGRRGGEGMGEPVVRVGRRVGRAAVLGPQRRPAEIRGEDARGDRQGDGQGSPRRGDGSGHRRPRREQRDHLDHA
jgi:dihydroorotase/N-acyl-D-amino-acid deacylase